MSARVVGPISWSMVTDSEGYRTVKLKLWVKTTSPLDGPSVVSQATGLPHPGDAWLYDNDMDLWLWCRRDQNISPKLTGEPNVDWEVEHTFSNRQDDGKTCVDTRIDDPLLTPDKISGAFTRYSREAVYDRFGFPICNSAWEQIRGAQVEFEHAKPTVCIEQNVADLQLADISYIIDVAPLNDAPLWGLPRRWVRLVNMSWDKKYYGQCYVYYTRRLEFEISSEWDRDILDEGFKVLNGHWGLISKSELAGKWYLDNVNGVAPNPFNPSHFIKATDPLGNSMKVVLDGAGKPIWYLPTSYSAKTATVEFASGGYSVGDLLTLIGGTFSTAAVLRVIEVALSDSVDPETGLVTEYAGAIRKVEVATPGTYTIVPDNPAQINASPSYPQFNVQWRTTAAGGTVAGNIHIEKYGESNLLFLGIPVVF